MPEADLLDALVVALDAIGVDGASERLRLEPAVTFADLGIDSLGTIEVVTRFEEVCGLSIPEPDIDLFEGPADVVAHAVRLLSKVA